jgi:hypothetical protein
VEPNVFDSLVFVDGQVFANTTFTKDLCRLLIVQVQEKNKKNLSFFHFAKAGIVINHRHLYRDGKSGGLIPLEILKLWRQKNIRLTGFIVIFREKGSNLFPTQRFYIAVRRVPGSAFGCFFEENCFEKDVFCCFVSGLADAFCSRGRR